MLIQSHWHCWKSVIEPRLDEEKGGVKGKHFCHPKETRPGLSAGDRGWQQDGCSYYHNTGNDSHWENGTTLWFPLPSQSEGRKDNGVVMEVFIRQPCAAWVLYSGASFWNKHFYISLCCLKSQLRLSIAHEERSRLLWVP